MNNEKLERANKIKLLLEKLKATRDKLSKQEKTEWIDFTYGNGSDCVSFSYDRETIYDIKKLVLSKIASMINELEKEFESL